MPKYGDSHDHGDGDGDGDGDGTLRQDLHEDEIPKAELWPFANNCRQTPS